MFETLQAIIVDPLAPRRAQLKEMLSATDRYKSVRICSRFANVESLLAEAEECIDVIGISRQHPAETVRSFIEACADNRLTQDSVFVVLLQPEMPTKLATAEALSLGAHSCLKEPYSVDDVRAVTQQALALRKKFTERRRRLAITEIVREFMKYLDLLYQKSKARRDPGRTLKDLREAGAAIAQIPAAQREVYYELLLEEFMNAKVPYFLPGISNYSGTSRATQRRAFESRKAEEQARAAGNWRKPKKRKPQELPNGRILPPT